MDDTNEEKKMKRVRSFGEAQRKKDMQRVHLNRRDELVKNITCDFKTWQLQWDANHSELNNTMQRLIQDFTTLLKKND